MDVDDVDVDDVERRRYLAVYLNDHLAGASTGLARFARAARAHRGSDTGAALERLRREVEEDRSSLQHWMRVLDVPRHRPLQVAGRVVEAVGALKPNGRVVRASPLRTVVELEALLLAVEGKAAGWRSLLEIAAADQRLDSHALDELLQRADRQSSVLEALRRGAVQRVLGGGQDGPR